MILRIITEMLKFPEGLRIPVLGGWWYNFLTNLDNKSIKREKISNSTLNKEPREKKVIVSLTSFPARIDFVYLAIKSLMIQTYKPDRIILWLAEEQFKDKKLPQNLLELVPYGLEIIYCSDLRGHKRYCELIKNQTKEELIITFDDDIIFSPLTLKRLMKKHSKHPDCVIAERAQSLVKNINGTVVCAGRWKTISNIGVKKPSYKLMASPGGGCLYPYGALHKDCYNVEKIRKLAYGIDDIWLMFMTINNNRKIIKTRKFHKTFSTIQGSQDLQVGRDNIFGGVYDDTFKILCNEYPYAHQLLMKKVD